MKSISELQSLAGRTALVTGGAGHLGRTFCETLAELGAGVAVVDIRQETCDELAEKLTREYGVQAQGYALDLADQHATRALPEKVATRFGGLDILINNAGFVGTSGLTGWVTTFEEQTIETWRAAMEVNLTSPFFLVQAAYPYLKASGKGSVINIASIYGTLGPDMGLYEGTNMGNPAAYAASKGGLIQATRWLSTVLAPDVRVNCMSPGGVWRNQPESFVERYTKKTPLRRMGTEEDFKGAIAFLAGDLSAYVTGQHILVDGGFSTL